MGLLQLQAELATANATRQASSEIVQQSLLGYNCTSTGCIMCSWGWYLASSSSRVLPTQAVMHTHTHTHTKKLVDWEPACILCMHQLAWYIVSTTPQKHILPLTSLQYGLREHAGKLWFSNSLGGNRQYFFQPVEQLFRWKMAEDQPDP